MGVGEDIRAAHEATQIERRLKSIAEASADRRITLVRQLHDHFVPRLVPKFLPQVTKLLSDDNPAVRHQAVLLLQHLFDLHPKGFAKASGPLAGLVQDTRMDNRTTALELLDKVARQEPKAVLPQLAKLVERLDNPQPGVQAPLLQLITDLGRRAPTAVAAQLAKQLGSRKPATVRNALALLEQVAEKQPAALARAAPRLVKLLGHRNSAIQKQAGLMLISAGAAGVAAVPRLLLRPLTARKVDPELRLHAILTAQPLAERDPGLFAPAVRHLAHDLGHQRWEIREQAALLLGIMGRKKMSLIKDAVPSLVHALNDGDDLVRTAAAKAMEEIKVSSLDYDALQKASAALESARGVLHSAQNFGVATGQADKLLADAEKAYGRGDYPKCMDYSTRAEDIAARAEKESDRVKAALTRAESTIQSVSHKGVSIAAAEALLAEAEKLLEKQRYKEAHEKAEQALLLSQQQAVESRPDIVLRGRVESPLVPDDWSVLSLELENIGGAVARQITLDFGDSFATRGQTLLHGMEATEKRTLEIEVYPKGKGLVPLTVDVVYHSFEGANFHQQKQDIVEVNDSTEFESRELFASAVGATVVPETQTSVVTRHFHIDCDNCGARLPSDFRICGKCGVRLRERVERSDTGYHCLECNSPLSLNQKFCGGCGSATPAKPEAPTSCRQCGGALEAGQKFCGGCGAPVILT